MISYALNKLIESGKIKEVKPLPENPLYIVGDIYWCGYWQKYYKVLAASYEPHRYKNKIVHSLKKVKIMWQDGTVAEHCTNLDKMRDYRIILSPEIYEEMRG